jgi:hypothetical protein
MLPFPQSWLHRAVDVFESIMRSKSFAATLFLDLGSVRVTLMEVLMQGNFVRNSFVIIVSTLLSVFLPLNLLLSHIGFWSLNLSILGAFIIFGSDGSFVIGLFKNFNMKWRKSKGYKYLPFPYWRPINSSMTFILVFDLKWLFLFTFRDFNFKSFGLNIIFIIIKWREWI